MLLIFYFVATQHSLYLSIPSLLLQRRARACGAVLDGCARRQRTQGAGRVPHLGRRAILGDAAVLARPRAFGPAGPPGQTAGRGRWRRDARGRSGGGDGCCGRPCAAGGRRHVAGAGRPIIRAIISSAGKHSRCRGSGVASTKIGCWHDGGPAPHKRRKTHNGIIHGIASAVPETQGSQGASSRFTREGMNFTIKKF
jgi:hypothetical protein